MNVTVAGRRGVALTALAVAFGAAGCSGGNSTVATGSSTSRTATIGAASPSESTAAGGSGSSQQAQAYQAAVKTYNDYWQGLENALATHGDPTRMARIARADAFSYAVTVARYATSKGYTLKGHIDNVYVRPTGFILGGTTKKPSRVTLTSCQDLSENSYVDKSGRSVPRDADAAKFVKFDSTVVNFSSSLTKDWQVDGLKTTVVKSCA